MDDIVITLKHHNEAWDLALPKTVPLQQLAVILADSLNLEEFKTLHETSFISGRINNNLIIRPHETLEIVRAVDGDFLELFITPNNINNRAVARDKGTYFRSVDTDIIIPCRGRAMLIGRARSNPICLQDLPNSDAVSRTHANLLRREDGYWLKDERSKNGTIVDGDTLKPGGSIRLRDESVVQFGVDGPVLIFHQSDNSL